MRSKEFYGDRYALIIDQMVESGMFYDIYRIVFCVVLAS